MARSERFPPTFGGRLARFATRIFSLLPMSNITRLMKYRDREGRVLFVAVTAWGTGEYGTFFRGENNELKPIVSPYLPLRDDFRQAQTDLDHFAQVHNLQAVE
jgi:hypothetical protein